MKRPAPNRRARRDSRDGSLTIGVVLQFIVLRMVFSESRFTTFPDHALIVGRDLFWPQR